MSNQGYSSSVMYPIKALADRLVLSGLRSWIAGLRYDDANCFEAGWTVLSNELPVGDARKLFSALERLAFALREAGAHGQVTWPISCRMANHCEQMTLAAAALRQRGLRTQGAELISRALHLEQGEGLWDLVEDALTQLVLALDECGLTLSCQLAPLLDSAPEVSDLHGRFADALKRSLN